MAIIETITQPIAIAGNLYIRNIIKETPANSENVTMLRLLFGQIFISVENSM